MGHPWDVSFMLPQGQAKWDIVDSASPFLLHGKADRSIVGAFRPFCCRDRPNGGASLTRPVNFAAGKDRTRHRLGGPSICRMES